MNAKHKKSSTKLELNKNCIRLVTKYYFEFIEFLSSKTVFYIKNISTSIYYVLMIMVC